MDIWTVLWEDGAFHFSRYLAAIVSAAPFTAIYAVSNVIFLLLFAPPIGKILARLKTKYALWCYRDGELHSVLYGIRHITAVSQNLQVIYDHLVDSKGADEKQIAELNREFDGINSALLDFIDRNGWNVFADQIRDEKK